MANSKLLQKSFMKNETSKTNKEAVVIIIYTKIAQMFSINYLVNLQISEAHSETWHLRGSFLRT